MSLVYTLSFCGISGNPERQANVPERNKDETVQNGNPVKIHRNTVHVNGIDLFYLDTRTNGIPILCLHGRWGRAEVWADFMQHYGGDYRIIAPDQRGHGLSGKPVAKYTAEEMAADMTALLDALQTGPVILVGHSMGGYVAGTLAAKNPGHARAVALLDKSASGPDKPGTLPADSIPAVDPLTKDWPLPFSTLTEARDYIRQATDSDLSYQYFMNSLIEKPDGYHMMFSSQAMAANIAAYENWTHLLPEIQCPVLLIRSSSHEAVPDADFEMMQRLLKDCTAFEVSHPDHNVQLGNKDEFYKYFDTFLEKTGLTN
ncbi:alpha/beta hydrolase [bacterium]|nr:alpha/beta hydrolase [bacterium]